MFSEPKPENIAGPCAWCGEPVLKSEDRYEFPDGEIYIVYYIVDDAVDRGQIRGCSLQPSDFFLP